MTSPAVELGVLRAGVAPERQGPKCPRCAARAHLRAADPRDDTVVFFTDVAAATALGCRTCGFRWVGDVVDVARAWYAAGAVDALALREEHLFPATSRPPASPPPSSPGDPAGDVAETDLAATGSALEGGGEPGGRDGDWWEGDL